MASLTLLSACSVGPNYHPPGTTTLGIPASYPAPPAPGGTGDLAQWWQAFNDPMLTDLIARATASNLDVRQSEARLLEARESLVQARAAVLPSVTGSVGATRSNTYGQSSLIVGSGDPGSGGAVVQTNGRSTQLSLGLDASWQADLFGGVRHSIESSRADEKAAEFNLVAVRTSVAGEVARNYVDARLAQSRLEIARDALKTQDDNLDVATWRARAGLVSSIDQEQARAQRAQTSATIPAIETSFRSSLNRLAVLSGRAPGALETAMAAISPIPYGSERISIGIPADTMRRRPDVRAAERQLAAATARIGVAKAQLFPALSFTGTLNTAASGIGSIGNIFTSSLFAGLTQAIFDRGRLRSQVRSAAASADEALANYEAVILSGLEEADNALQSLDAAKRREGALTEARDASLAAAILARSQYGVGLTDFQTLLLSEQALLSASDALATAKADRSTALIQLYLAVGGGWEPGRSDVEGDRYD